MIPITFVFIQVQNTTLSPAGISTFFILDLRSILNICSFCPARRPIILLIGFMMALSPPKGNWLVARVSSSITFNDFLSPDVFFAHKYFELSSVTLPNFTSLELMPIWQMFIFSWKMIGMFCCAIVIILYGLSDTISGTEKNNEVASQGVCSVWRRSVDLRCRQNAFPSVMMIIHFFFFPSSLLLLHYPHVLLCNVKSRPKK